MTKIFFYEKTSTKDVDEDILITHEIDEDPTIREIIRNLENKILGNKRNLKEINPNNPSVKKWVQKLLTTYPKEDKEAIDDLLNEFRAVLQTRSKEKEKFIVGILQLNDTIIIAHSKKDASLAELKDKIYTVKTVFHPKNIIRADIIKNENGNITLSAFEYSRKWSKGHANFWGIEPEDIGWQSLGSITLVVELERFQFPIQIPIETEQLKESIDNKEISSTGKITIGREEGKITQVFVYGKLLDFPKFYDFFVTETEKLDNYKKKFNELINKQPLLKTFFDKTNKFQYEEDEGNIYEITTSGSIPIVQKEHPRFSLCFFTKNHPGIRPSQKLLWSLYQSIFENKKIELWHAGEDSTLEPICIGNLNVYNQLIASQELFKFSNTLLNKIQDIESKKAKAILQYCFCYLFINNLENVHIKYLFDFLNEIIIKDIEHEFAKNDALFQKEDLLEFKSSDQVTTKPSVFAKEILVPTIKGYISNGTLRHCILYGVEDNGTFKPLYHLKSDQITTIENITNSELDSSKIRVSIQPISFKEGTLLAVFLLPNLKKNVEAKIQAN